MELTTPSGDIVLIDDADFPIVSAYKWKSAFNSTKEHTKYAYAYVRLGPKKYKRIKMHRLILGMGEGCRTLGDHKNGNGLDNRRENLRPCDSMRNQQNRKRSWSSAGFKGVQALPNGKYTAGIRFKKKQTHLGTFTSKEAAAIAYNAKALELFGEFASLNQV